MRRLRGSTPTWSTLNLVFAGALLVATPVSGQFRADFDEAPLATDPRALDGWAFFSGDGAATVDFVQGDGFASVVVDATADTLNIWWALVKHQVSSHVDLERLSRPGSELRVEARVRASAAPRRINLHVNTQRTTDFHSHLMEYDLADTTGWHTISMTTRGFDAVPGDTIYAQLALMDWGLDRYRLDIDYLSVEVVEEATASTDVGNPIPYHGAMPDPAALAESVPAAEAAIIDTAFPYLNLDAWEATTPGGSLPVLTVGGTQWTILRWDLSAFAGRRVEGPGLLELPTHALQRARHDRPELGQIRVVEILGGDPDWERGSVTYASLLRNRPVEHVINPQMIVDVEVADPGSTTRVTITEPVLQRLIDGTTVGLVLRPLGPIHASFESGADGEVPIHLRFDME